MWHGNFSDTASSAKRALRRPTGFQPIFAGLPALAKRTAGTDGRVIANRAAFKAKPLGKYKGRKLIEAITCAPVYPSVWIPKPGGECGRR